MNIFKFKDIVTGMPGTFLEGHKFIVYEFKNSRYSLQELWGSYQTSAAPQDLQIVKEPA